MIIRFVFLCAAIGASCVTVAPTLAQPIGSLIGRRAEAKDLDGIMTKLAECIYKRQPSFVTKLMHITPGSKDEAKLTQRYQFDFDACIDERSRVEIVGLKMNIAALRGRLARQAVVGRLDGSQPQVPNDKPVLGYSAHLSALPDPRQFGLADVVAHQMAVCIARSNWGAATALLKSAVGSNEEIAAFKSVGPSLPSCLPAKQKLTTTKRSLRDALSEAVYHMLETARA